MTPLQAYILAFLDLAENPGKRKLISKVAALSALQNRDIIWLFSDIWVTIISESLTYPMRGMTTYGIDRYQREWTERFPWAE